MLIAIFGESCTGKSTLADKLKEKLDAEIYSGKDYLRLAGNEAIAKKLFQKKLTDAIHGGNIIYVIAEKEHLALLPEGCVRILVTADLETIKQRFVQRLRGNLPTPVAAMLERNHGCFDGESHDYHVVSGETDLDALVEKLFSTRNVSMNETAVKAWRDSVAFWNQAYALPEGENLEETENKAQDWHTLAPSEKQLRAIEELASCKKLLDYGCGQGWASVIAAKAGCPSVTAVDVAENGVKGAELYAKQYGVADKIRCDHIPANWLETEAPERYDGFFSSNVLDVVPTEVAERILAEAYRVLQPGSRLVISLNYYMEPKENTERKITVQDGHYVFVDGVLRLNSLTDDEWKALFEKYFSVDSLEYYAWPGEETERRRLFRLIKQ